MIDIPAAIKIANEALAGVKGLVELFGKFRTAKPNHEDISAAYERMLNLQQSILNTMEALVFLKEENASLKEQLSKLKDFAAFRQDFELKEIADGALAYVHKEAKEINKRIPWYCQACLDKGQKSVFQFAKRESQHDIHQCYLCGSQLRIRHGIEQKPQVSIRGTTGKFRGDW